MDLWVAITSMEFDFSVFIWTEYVGQDEFMYVVSLTCVGPRFSFYILGVLDRYVVETLFSSKEIHGYSELSELGSSPSVDAKREEDTCNKESIQSKPESIARSDHFAIPL
jgi:hypothetical protein